MKKIIEENEVAVVDDISDFLHTLTKEEKQALRLMVQGARILGFVKQQQEAAV
jgi:hypothetical protein